MRRRFHIGTLVSVGMLLAASAFAAGRPAPEITPFGNQPIIPFGATNGVQSACRIGVLGTATSLVNYLLPPDDAYLTLIKASDCPGCSGPGGVEATIAHMLLQFPVANCNTSITVSIVGATGTPACRVPDPTMVLCPPTTFSLVNPTTGVFDFSLPLPAGCCITGDAFLSITVNSLSCNTTATRPRLVTNGAGVANCVACTSYNIYPGGNDELCLAGFPGNPMMSLEVDCCNVVSTSEASWGSLKIRYRD